MGVDGCWCAPWSSKPVMGVRSLLGGFDSHIFPPKRTCPLRGVSFCIDKGESNPPPKRSSGSPQNNRGFCGVSFDSHIFPPKRTCPLRGVSFCIDKGEPNPPSKRSSGSPQNNRRFCGVCFDSHIFPPKRTCPLRGVSFCIDKGESNPPPKRLPPPCPAGRRQGFP